MLKFSGCQPHFRSWTGTCGSWLPDTEDDQASSPDQVPLKMLQTRGQEATGHVYCVVTVYLYDVCGMCMYTYTCVLCVWRPEDNLVESALLFHVSVGSGYRTKSPRLAQQVHLPDEPFRWPPLHVLTHEVLCGHSQAHWLTECLFHFRAVAEELSRDHEAANLKAWWSFS